MNRIRLALRAALTALLAAACTGDGGLPSDSVPTPSTPCQPPSCTEIAVSAFDFYYRPENLTVPAGKVRFTLHNLGRQVHNLTLDDGAKPATPNLLPGIQGFVDVDLTAKTYTLFCAIPTHLQQGMKTTLTAR